MANFKLLINGRQHNVDTIPERSLLSVLRDDLDLTGAKYGCGEGQCGACTVLLDGAPARSCLTPVQAATGRTITSIEGIASGDKLHPLQQAFMDVDAMQCGYCTPGMIMSGVALLRRKPDATDADIRQALQGNICRCGTYPRIIEAVRRAAVAAKQVKGTHHG